MKHLRNICWLKRLFKGKKMDKKADISKFISTSVPYIGLVLLIIISVIVGGKSFVATKNLRNIMTQSSILMVVSVGTAFVMAHGDMDFANGGTMGLAMVVTLALCKGIPSWAVFPMCLAVGTIIGIMIGFLVTRLRVVAFIVGMCVMRLSSAILYTTTNKTTWLAPAGVTALNKPWFYLLSCLGMVILGIIVFEFTEIGQYNKLIGVNNNAASLSGINVNKYLVYSFAVSGLCAGVAAFMTTVRTGGLSSSTGNYEVDTLIALTIGGMPLTGGSKASIRAAVTGALALTILNNILVLRGVNADFVNVVKGIVFLTLVLISSRRNAGQITG